MDLPTMIVIKPIGNVKILNIITVPFPSAALNIGVRETNPETTAIKVGKIKIKHPARLIVRPKLDLDFEARLAVS